MPPFHMHGSAFKQNGARVLVTIKITQPEE